MTNKPEVSPAMTAEERVKAIYPEAYATYNGYLRVTEVWSTPEGGEFLGQADGRWIGEPDAWIGAASRLPASPVAEGESQTTHKEGCPCVIAQSQGEICSRECGFCTCNMEVGSMETGKSADKWDALRKAAEAATGGSAGEPWWCDGEDYPDEGGYVAPMIVGRSQEDPYVICELAVGHNEQKNGEFIALANPAAILELLNELATLSVTEGVDGREK